MLASEFIKWLKTVPEAVQMKFSIILRLTGFLHGSMNDAVSTTQVTSTEWKMTEWLLTVIWRWFGRKWSCRVLRYYKGTLLEGLNKNTELSVRVADTGTCSHPNTKPVYSVSCYNSWYVTSSWCLSPLLLNRRNSDGVQLINLFEHLKGSRHSTTWREFASVAAFFNGNSGRLLRG